MRKKLFSTLAVTAVVVTACGGGGGDRDEAADLFIDAMDEQGLDVDRGCVSDIVDELSDDDVQTILDDDGNGDATLSEEGQAISAELLDCVGIGDMVDTMIDQLVANMGEENVDVDCLRDALDGLDLANPDDPVIATAMLDCVEIGG
jgi:hypothetical protein